ncbi:hypothetical protein [Streptomyces sp. NPDC047886]|uniref:hypothetical protein n=1 Tax=Streptomyces sp. NPDC047886 TaxID=3365490 RepID=UPI00371C817D
MREVMDNIYVDLFYVVGGLVFTFSAWGSWWAAIPALFTGSWIVLLIQRVIRDRKEKVGKSDD